MLVAHGLEALRNLVVRELAEVVLARERLVHALRRTELHRARTVKTNVGEQRHGVVGAHPEFAANGAPLELTVRQQTKEIGPQHVGTVDAV